MSSSIRNDRRLPSALGRALEHSVSAMRIGIVATTSFWLASGEQLWATVCTVLTYLPAVSVQDPVMRIATGLCLTVLLFAHIVFGMQSGLYETSSLYDKVIHALGCGAIAGLVIAAISQYCARKRLLLPRPLYLLLAIGIVVSLSTMWELFEFAIDRTGPVPDTKGP